jgi:hypothetical protein
MSFGEKSMARWGGGEIPAKIPFLLLPPNKIGHLFTFEKCHRNITPSSATFSFIAR